MREMTMVCKHGSHVGSGLLGLIWDRCVERGLIFLFR